jgi:nitrite reductase/ring-hydroxylating ferredoxin subunit
VASNKMVVGRPDDIAEGERKLYNVNGRDVVIFRRDNEYFGLLNRCPHRGASLCEGRFVSNITSEGPGEYEFHGDEKMLACPWHGWEFDIRTGQSYFDPSGVRSRPYPVAVVSGDEVRKSIAAGETGLTPDEFRELVSDHDTESVDGRIPGPYVAETLSVVVEDNYLVVLHRPARPARKKD